MAGRIKPTKYLAIFFFILHGKKEKTNIIVPAKFFLKHGTVFLSSEKVKKEGWALISSLQF